MENLYTTDCIRTFKGIYMNVFEPTLEMIDIEDIAHALSNLCRFGGHLPEFYSVAQHSVLCSDIITTRNKLAALMHDASEAYLIDVPRPIKHRLTNYKEIEDKLMILIAQKFGFLYPLHHTVKYMDEQMLKAEWNQLMLGKKIVDNFKCWSPGYAKERFLERFNEFKNTP
ncbi:MAG: phosphohydrolase [Bacteroidales bacterium]